MTVLSSEGPTAYALPFMLAREDTKPISMSPEQLVRDLIEIDVGSGYDGESSYRINDRL